MDVWSGRALYQEADAPLPAILATLPRTQLHQPVGQAALAAALRGAAFLAYPAIVPETGCIVALEAMAAGLKVVSTTIGALPQTCMGFADLMPLEDGMTRAAMAARFTLLIERNVADFLERRREWAEERFAQSREIVRHCNWAARAQEWEVFLAPAVAWKRGT